MTPDEKPQIVAKEVSNEAGVYEIKVTYPSSPASDSGAPAGGPAILRTTPKMFAFQTQTPRDD